MSMFHSIHFLKRETFTFTGVWVLRSQATYASAGGLHKEHTPTHTRTHTHKPGECEHAAKAHGEGVSADRELEETLPVKLSRLALAVRSGMRPLT